MDGEDEAKGELVQEMGSWDGRRNIYIDRESV